MDTDKQVREVTQKVVKFLQERGTFPTT